MEATEISKSLKALLEAGYTKGKLEKEMHLPTNSLAKAMTKDEYPKKWIPKMEEFFKKKSIPAALESMKHALESMKQFPSGDYAVKPVQKLKDAMDAVPIPAQLKVEIVSRQPSKKRI